VWTDKDISTFAAASEATGEDLTVLQHIDLLHFGHCILATESIFKSAFWFFLISLSFSSV